MSCLTAPPLVSLLSLSRVQSQINSKLFLTLTYPSTRLHLQLAPRLCPCPPVPPPHRRSRWQQPRKKGRPPAGGCPGRRRRPPTSPRFVPGCAAVLSARSRERGGGCAPRLPRSSGRGATAQRRPPASLLQTWGRSPPKQQQRKITDSDKKKPQMPRRKTKTGQRGARPARRGRAFRWRQRCFSALS